jgi:hypothetical protein
MSNIAIRGRATFDDTSRRIGWTIVATKLRASRNRLAVMRRKTPALVSLHFGIAVPAVLGFTALLLVGFASALSGVEDASVSRALLAVVIAFACIGAFIGSSTTALQAMFLADDIPFLLTLPIPLRALFGSKFLEAALGVAPAAMLLMAGAGGYGIVEAEHISFWPIAGLVLIGFLLMATAASVIIVSLVTRFIPPRRARLFLLCISLSVMAFTLLAWRVLAPQPEKLGNVVSRGEYEPIWNALQWTPVGVGAVALQKSAQGEYVHALIATGALLTASALVVAISFHVFRRTFFRGFAQTRAVQTAQPNSSITSGLSAIAGVIPHRAGSLVLKEWLVLFRDLRRLSGAMWPLGVVLVYTILLGRRGGATFGSDDFEFWSRNGSLALLPWGMSLGISVYSFGSEGRNIQLMRSLPFSARAIYLSKALASILPVLVVSVGAAVISLWLRQAPLVSSLELIALMVWMICGYALIDTAASALAPNFETDQVQRTIGLSGRIFSFVAGGCFSVATLVAAGRAIMFLESEPKSLSDILGTRIGSVEPFGWPLVALAGFAAVTVVLLSAKTAINRTQALLSESA